MEDLKITDEDPGRQLSSLRPISWALGLRQLGNHAFIQFQVRSRYPIWISRSQHRS